MHYHVATLLHTQAPLESDIDFGKRLNNQISEVVELSIYC